MNAPELRIYKDLRKEGFKPVDRGRRVLIKRDRQGITDMYLRMPEGSMFEGKYVHHASYQHLRREIKRKEAQL